MSFFPDNDNNILEAICKCPNNDVTIAYERYSKCSKLHSFKWNFNVLERIPTD